MSDSKLAVDYFTTTNADLKSEVSSVKSDTSYVKGNGSDVVVSPQFMSKSFNASESHHSLGGMISNEEKLLKEVS